MFSLKRPWRTPVSDTILSKVCTSLLLLAPLALVSCQLMQTATVKNELRNIKSAINLGDNIFDAKKILEDQGYSVDGPKFFTPSKSTYLMVVDFGVRPNAAQIFAYTTGIDYPWRNIRGVIEADRSGTIYKIE